MMEAQAGAARWSSTSLLVTLRPEVEEAIVQLLRKPPGVGPPWGPPALSGTYSMPSDGCMNAASSTHL